MTGLKRVDISSTSRLVFTLLILKHSKQTSPSKLEIKQSIETVSSFSDYARLKQEASEVSIKDLFNFSHTKRELRKVKLD